MPKLDFAVIFDMNGVIVKDAQFNKKAWKLFCKKHGFDLTDEQHKNHVQGRVNSEILQYLFGKKLTKKQIGNYSEEKESIYRRLYRNRIAPMRGLLEFLGALRKNKIKTALATSACPKNVEFVLTAIKAKKYFDVIVDDTHVDIGKPHPEIYLKTAKRLKVKPSKCIVFEDSFSGIQSALDAGMKVIAITTTHAKGKLTRASLVIDDFSQIDLGTLAGVLESKK